MPRRQQRAQSRVKFPELEDKVIVGIDPSSKKIAWRVFNSSGSKIGTFQIPKKLQDPYSPYNSGQVVTSFLSVFTEERSIGLSNHHVWLEEPLVGRGGVRATLSQAYVSGALQGVLYDSGATVDLVHPSTWKAKVVGHGGASKEQIAEYLRLRWPSLYKFSGGDGDILDATAIALYGVGQECGFAILDE